LGSDVAEFLSPPGANEEVKIKAGSALSVGELQQVSYFSVIPGEHRHLDQHRQSLGDTYPDASDGSLPGSWDAPKTIVFFRV
jgi:hypothetical protein